MNVILKMCIYIKNLFERTNTVYIFIDNELTFAEKKEIFHNYISRVFACITRLLSAIHPSWCKPVCLLSYHGNHNTSVKLHGNQVFRSGSEYGHSMHQ